MLICPLCNQKEGYIQSRTFYCNNCRAEMIVEEYDSIVSQYPELADEDYLEINAIVEEQYGTS